MKMDNHISTHILPAIEKLISEDTDSTSKGSMVTTKQQEILPLPSDTAVKKTLHLLNMDISPKTNEHGANSSTTQTPKKHFSKLWPKNTLKNTSSIWKDSNTAQEKNSSDPLNLTNLPLPTSSYHKHFKNGQHRTFLTLRYTTLTYYLTPNLTNLTNLT